MDENWDKVVQWTLQEEGSDLRDDRGWHTKYGVDVLGFARYKGVSGVCLDELEELDREAATKILRSEWEEAKLESYPSGLDYFVFDCCLFCSRSVSIGWIGLALCRMDIRGVGDEEVVVRAVSNMRPEDAMLLLEKVGFLRRRRHKSQPGHEERMPAWTNRVTRVQRRARQLVAHAA